MSIRMSGFLRGALLVDAVATVATGVLLVAGGRVLSGALGLPAGFLIAAGLPLIPFGLFVAWLGRGPEVSRTAVHLVMWSNALWVAASIGILAARLFEPTGFGVLFVLAQAVAVAGFAEAQYVGLRRAQAR